METTVELTPMQLAQRAATRWGAKIQAILPLAHKGDPEAQQELLEFTAQRAAVEEEINKSRSPAEQVRLYTKALLAKQISLEAAEKDVVVARE